MSTINSDWLICLNPTLSAPKVKLICFPFAGGGIVNYSKWRADLHESIKLYAINLPGRERFFNQPCLTDYHELIEHLAAIVTNESDCPMVFFGHSFGALTAYFTTLELKKLHRSGPVHLYVSARVPPSKGLSDPISNLNKEDFKSVLIERYQGIPQAILNNPEFLAMFLPIIQSDFKLYEQFPQILASYPDQVINCDITSISYSEDRYSEDDIIGWRDVTNKSHQHLRLSGGHFDLLMNWKPIVEHINQWVQSYYD